MNFIPVNEPLISERAIENVNECLQTGWISSSGKFIDQFEDNFAQYLGVSYATTVSNGTTALHLALASIGIEEGDEVIVPDLTIISCALAPLYIGAKPVLVDVDPATGNIDPKLIEAKITPRTKAIMVVHLYGQPADMDPIMDIARKHKLLVIEDAAEAHGAEYKGRKVGSIGDIATFSFYANKIVTTGEGGIVVTNNSEFIQRAKHLKNLAHHPKKRFFHEELGFNYRMSNLHAALGVAHLEDIEENIKKKEQMAEYYQKLLEKIDDIELPKPTLYGRSVYWMYTVLLKPQLKISRDDFMKKLLESGIETRTYFYPLHEQPVLLKKYSYDENEFPVSTDLAQRGLYLPSGLGLSEIQMDKVAHEVKNILH